MDKIEELINTIENQENDKTRNDYLRYFRNWPWFMVSVLLGLALALFLYEITPETYQVQSRLIVYGEENTISSELSFNEPRYGEKSNNSDQIGILNSFSVFSKTIENLDWKTTWYKKTTFSKIELYNNAPFDAITQEDAKNLTSVLLEITALNDKEYLIAANAEAFVNGVKQKVKFEDKAYFNQPYKNEYFHFSLSNRNGNSGEKYSFVFNNPNLLTSYYQKKVELIANPKESELVIIQSEGQNPQKEADFLNKLNKVFIQFGMEKKTQISENSVSFIEEQAKEVKDSLKKAEERINNYRKANGSMNLGQEANVVYETLSEIENEKYDAGQVLEFYQNLKNNIGNSEKINQISTPAFVQNSSSGLNEMLTELKNLYTRREVLTFSVKEKSPNYIRLEKKIEMVYAGIKESLDNLIFNAKREKQNIDSRFQTVQARLTQLPETEKNLISMQRDFDVNNELYNFLLKKKAEASISQASIAPQAKIIDPALSEYAVRLGPNLIIFVFSGIFLGLIIPFLLITLVGYFNTKIESEIEIESASKIPVLDEIIHHKYKDSLPILNHPHSGITESFRNLKVKVLNKIPEQHQKVISINSMISGEGKSFISANFAATLSLNKKRVLLVGTDLRNPSLNSVLDIQSGKGLSSFLSNESGFDDIIHSTSFENLFFVQSGAIPDNPSELLENEMFEQFVNIAREQFDYIVLDNAPLLLVPDANWTSRYSDINLFILRLNYSRKKEISNINKLIVNVGIKNSFLVVNDAPQKGYGYGSRYWKKGYGNYNKKMKIA